VLTAVTTVRVLKKKAVEDIKYLVLQDVEDAEEEEIKING